jgi:hypothetical protein
MATAPKPKKKLPKRPTGELPKRMSSAAFREYARSGAEGKKNLITPSAAGALAGKMRDKAKPKATPKPKVTPKRKGPAEADYMFPPSTEKKRK